MMHLIRHLEDVRNETHGMHARAEALNVLMRTRSRMPPSYIVWLGFHRYWAGVEHWIGEM